MAKKYIRCSVLLFLLGCLSLAPFCVAVEVLFEDNLENGLSDKWQMVGLGPNDYRVRESALEIRLKPWKAK